VDLHGEILATTESAPDACEVDAHLLWLEPKAGRDLVAVDVQPLSGDVDVDPALAVGHREARLGAEEGLVLDPELVHAFDGHVALRDRIPVADGELPEDVLGALCVHDRLLRDVLDVDSPGGPARLLRVLGGDDGYRFTEVARVLHGQNRLVGKLEAVALFAGNVLVDQKGVDAGHPAGLADVDALDAGGGVRAAESVAEEHAGGEEVARVSELARNLGNRVDAANGFANAAVLELARRRAHRRAFA
jgi:hypothetical protein